MTGLAGFLPGLRETRGPLVGGLLWLMVLWLPLDPEIPAPEEGAIWRMLHDLAEFLGEAGLVAILVFAAYLFGSLIDSAAGPIRRRLRRRKGSLERLPGHTMEKDSEGVVWFKVEALKELGDIEVGVPGRGFQRARVNRALRRLFSTEIGEMSARVASTAAEVEAVAGERAKMRFIRH